VATTREDTGLASDFRRRVRDHRWSPSERAVLIAVLAIAMGALFLTTYTLALGDPVPRRIDAALVGAPATHPRTIDAVQQVADASLAFRRYDSVAAAREAIHRQRVYAALDVRSARPALYVASAAGASVARVLERVSASDPHLRVVDVHPLAPSDPNGIDIFYLMLVATIVGFTTVFQVRANAGGMPLRHWTAFVAAFAPAAALVLTLVAGPALGRLPVPVASTWGILTLHVLAVASFASIMSVLIGRWAILPTWLFFVVLGNSASGGAVAPPLLPSAFAFVSQWLPSGATVTALRNAIYFRGYEHARPILVLVGWAGLFVVMLAVSQHRRASPGRP
jgi:hypothetical protein